MIAIAFLFVRMLCDCFKPRQRLEAEILILRHQLKPIRYKTICRPDVARRSLERAHRDVCEGSLVLHCRSGTCRAHRQIFALSAANWPRNDTWGTLPASVSLPYRLSTKPLPHQQPLALPSVEVECPNSSGLRGLRVCRFDKPEKMSAAAADQRHAPTTDAGAGLGFGARTQRRHAR